MNLILLYVLKAYSEALDYLDLRFEFIIMAVKAKIKISQKFILKHMFLSFLSVLLPLLCNIAILNFVPSLYYELPNHVGLKTR